MKIDHSVLFLKSHKGFVLYHVLTFYLFFCSFITSVTLLHNVALIQKEYYKSASQKITVEKEVIRMIRKYDTIPINEEIEIQSKTIMLMIDDMIKATICDDTCYMMVVDYDVENDIVLNIDYE